ncbi:MAG: DUF3662 and FHA domain-containing protein [Coriobacteriia bacterium]|nr:DUF3662 and FHA domain-containing protein [Coriobacteriia bacterium]MBN2823164.1 DUF3662 and FHA domain-containing protein [Coriobacteriia bacterium]
MGILSDFEDRIAGGIEGLFAGAFRSPVQPVELAKALGKAMDNGRAVGVGKVYAPVSYTIALSAEDEAKLRSFEATLGGELATYLVDHANERRYELASRPVVDFVTHRDLKLGRFRVSAALAETGPDQAAEADTPHRRQTSVTEIATVTVNDMNHDVALRGEQIVIGRLSDAQIQITDANVSRRHAAFIKIDDGWAIQDLDSTNGTRLNGQPVKQARLHDGDIVEIGLTRLTYHEARR